MIKTIGRLYHFFFILTISLSLFIPSQTSVPIQFEIQSQSDHLYPFFVDFENEKYLLTQEGAFKIIESDSQYSLVPSSEIFDSNYHVGRETNKYYEINISDNSKYIFPFIRNNYIIKYFENGLFNDNIEPLPSIASDSKVDDCLFNSTLIILSYLTDTGNGLILLFNGESNLIDNYLTTSSSISSSGLFSCKYMMVTNLIICMYIKNSNTIVYITYDETANSFSNESTLYTDDDNSLVAIKCESVEEYLICLCILSPSNVYMLFKFKLSDGNFVIDKSEITDMPCTDIFTMNMKIIFLNYLFITGYNGEHTICRLYDLFFSKVSLNDKDFCGYNEFRVFYNNKSNTMHYTYIKDSTSYIYYYEHKVNVCSNKEIHLSKNDPLIITIKELIDIEEDDEISFEKYGFILFPYNVNKSNGYFSIIENDTETFTQQDLMYQQVQFTPSKIGYYYYIYQVIQKISDTYYFSSGNCTLTMVTDCYSNCKTCLLLGNDSEHNCVNCADNAFFEKDTNNCYFTPPPGYFLDSSNWVFDKCSDNCYSCTNENECVICNSGYTLLESYTHNESDKYCVPLCKDNYYWYYNKTFTCSSKENYCPPEYSCLDKSTLECKATIDSSCEIYTPNDINQIYDFFDSNSISYYQNNSVIETEDYVAIVYDSSSSNSNNHMHIETEECKQKLIEANIIKKNETILIGQIEMKTNEMISPLVGLYRLDGTKIDTSICNNSQAILSFPILNELSVDRTIIKDLLNKGINLIEPNDSIFNDICEPFSILSKDIIIKDRRQYFYQNVSLCGTDCEYIDISIETFSINCKCSFDNMKMIFNRNQGLNSFKSKINEGHFHIFKCYNQVFLEKTFTNNIGFYISICFLLGEIINFCIYCVKSKKIEDKICKKKSTITVNENCTIQNTNSMLNASNSITNNIFKYEKSCYSNINSISMEKHLFSKQKEVSLERSNSINSPYRKKTFGTSKLNPSPFKKQRPSKQQHQNKNKKINFDELSYEELLKQKDNRSFCEMFFIRIKHFHPIYILMTSLHWHPNITIAYYLNFIVLFILWNALLYSPKMISHIYRTGIKFHLHFIVSLCSYFISFIISIMFKLLMYKYPSKDVTNEVKRIQLLKRIKKCNYAILIVTFLLSILSLYYITVFCNIYQHNQLYMIYDILMSIGLFLFFPLIYALINVCFRKMSLSCQSETFFYFTRFIDNY